MTFRGWPPEAVDFYLGLEADNSRTYWTSHKAVYDASVQAPMVDLLDELSGEFGPARIARPYRDVRFRVDKTPYKTASYAMFERSGYVRFDATGLTAGLGYFRPAPDQLERYRRAVADDEAGPALVAIVERLRADGIEVGGASSLKGAPRGYPKDHPRVDLLRQRGLIAWRHWALAEWLHTGAAKERVVDFLRFVAPLQGWLDERVGPGSDAPTG
jgi:uncharacterized protein (TIGR02453 family)